ncbi:MAG: hypothetical protein WAS21_23440, partial [Geminicoccaceae bacterium]
PRDVRKERAARLRARGDAAFDGFLRAQVGQRRRTLIERGRTGHTDQMAPVRPATDAWWPPAGTIADMIVTGVDNGTLIGRLDA